MWDGQSTTEKQNVHDNVKEKRGHLQVEHVVCVHVAISVCYRERKNKLTWRRSRGMREMLAAILLAQPGCHLVALARSLSICVCVCLECVSERERKTRFQWEFSPINPGIFPK